MPNVSMNPDRDPLELQALRRLLERREYVVVLICAIVALIAGHFGGEISGFVTWWQFLIAGATILVAFIVAASALRFMDLLAVRRDLSRQVERSHALSRQLYARLEQRFPDVAERAQEIDPEMLLHRTLRKTKPKQQASSK